jgi:hypothetical protein
MTFTDDIAKFVKTAERRLKKVVVDSTLSLSTVIIMRTPVDAPIGWHDPDSVGFARGSWYVSFNGYSTRGIGGNDPSGLNTVQKITTQLQRYNVREHTSIHINNNAPYIGLLEHGGYVPPAYNFQTRIKSTAEGYSTQAPAGMVRVNAPMWPVMVVKATVSARMVQ